MKAVTLAALAVTLTAGHAMAGTPWVDQREHRQWTRIYNGIQSGRLTAPEAGRLIAGQARVRLMERAFKADGVVTLGERIRLHRALNRQSVRIWAKKHN